MTGGYIVKVQQLATPYFIKVTEHATARQLMEQFLNNKQDIACVIENGRLKGIVSKYALYRLLLATNDLNSLIQSIMIKNVVTVNENMSAYKAKDILIAEGIGHAVVLNNEEVVTGVLTKHELIQGLISSTYSAADRLKTLVNNLQEAVISVDLNLVITSVNRAALQLFNLEEEEVVKKLMNQLSTHLAIGLQDSIEKKESFIRKISFNTTTIIATFIPLKEWSEVNGAMVVLKDITELEQIAVELESTKKIEKTLESALELAYDGVIITNVDGLVTRINQSFLHFFNYESPEAVLLKPIENIFPEIAQSKPSAHAEIEGRLIKVSGQQAIISQMPIIQNGKRIGSIIKLIFKQLDIWKDLLGHMDKLEEEISYYRGELSKISYENDPFGMILSNNQVVKQLKTEAYIASQTFSNLLITGESGTGKELLADGIHLASGRPGAFIKVNCGAIPAELLESEFFGYADGAFTGAKKGGKPGKFELAEGGTLFLDEIGDMPLSLQVKLLRVLQEKEFERIGDTKTTKIDVRILAATNKNLLELVQKGLFREDLYYRLHVIQLHIPPLRERLDDIPLLTTFLLNKFNMRTPRITNGLTSDALNQLTNYHWPGNIRELENVLERAFHFSTTDWIHATDLKIDNQKQLTSIEQTTQLEKNPLEESEKNVIIHALTKTNGNRTKAAKLLNISRSTLYYKLDKYNIIETSEFKRRKND